MLFDINKLASDLVNLDPWARNEKLSRKIPPGIKNSEIVSALKLSNNIKKILRTDWKGNGRDQDGLYCIETNTSYEVFASERGFKLEQKTFNNIDDACFYWLDLLLYQLEYTPLDSQLHKS